MPRSLRRPSALAGPSPHFLRSRALPTPSRQDNRSSAPQSAAAVAREEATEARKAPMKMKKELIKVNK